MKIQMESNRIFVSFKFYIHIHVLIQNYAKQNNIHVGILNTQFILNTVKIFLDILITKFVL